MRIALRLVLAFLAVRFATAQTNSGEDLGLDSLPLEQLMEVRVQTATLRKQTLQNAPASVTVITAEDIRRFGWRTLGEALSNVRSFYATADGPFQFVGARGFSLLGDYNTRVLVLVNGHRLTDNVYSAMYLFGEDFPLDMDLVEQVEIVRGPSSALYGTNGVFATINILTRAPGSGPRGRIRTELGTYGEQKLAAAAWFPLGGAAKALVSVSASHGGGRHVEFPELARAGVYPSGTDHAGAGSGYHVFADVTWRNWTFTTLFGQYKSPAPTGWYKGLIGDTGTTDLEGRNYVEAVWNRQVGQTGAIQWRSYYDQFRYDGVYVYPRFRNYDGAAGDWVGSQFVYHHDFSRAGTLTLGAESSVDLRNLQYNYDLFDPESGGGRRENFWIHHRRTGLGLFAQQEISISPEWTAYFGGRVDKTTDDKISLSPRAALIYKREAGAYKLMYGRAFRNPSTYERFWQPNPALAAERIDTFEIAREQSLGRRANLIATVFHYSLGGLITGMLLRDYTLRYRNASKANATGVEVEASGQPAGWLEMTGGYSLQRTRGEDASRPFENSPARAWNVKASARLRQRLYFSAAVRHLGSRMGTAGNRAPAATLADVTLTAPRVIGPLAIQAGIRNLANSAYLDPLSPEHATTMLPGAGRSAFIRLTWQYE